VIRVTLFRVLLFALPFALYALYLLLGTRRPEARQHPWTPLIIAGLVLVASSFLVWRLREGQPVGTYVAPHLENGKVVPGHVEKGP
jgi:hypothetical protein